MNYRTKFRELEEKYVLLEEELASLRSQGRKDVTVKTTETVILDGIFSTVSSYLALFRKGDDGRFYITGLNSKVEEVEFIDRNEVIGKAVSSRRGAAAGGSAARVRPGPWALWATPAPSSLCWLCSRTSTRRWSGPRRRRWARSVAPPPWRRSYRS